MVPLQHHFELAGWSEVNIVVRFWIIAGIGVAIALGLFYSDFLASDGLTHGRRGPLRTIERLGGRRHAVRSMGGGRAAETAGSAGRRVDASEAGTLATRRPAAPRAGDRRRCRADAAGGLAALRGLLARPLASYYLLLSSAGLLLLIGLTMVFSATSVEDVRRRRQRRSPRSTKQAIFAVIGLVAFWVCQRLPARTYRALAPAAADPRVRAAAGCSTLLAPAGAS